MEGQHDHPALTRLLHLLDEVLHRKPIRDGEGRHIEWVVHRRAVGSLMAPAPKGVAIRDQTRNNRPDHLIDRPADRRHLRPAIRHHFILHPEIILQATTVTIGVIADFQAIRVHRVHLPIGLIPILPRLEGVEVTDINRPAKAVRLQNRRDHRGMAGRPIVKSQHDQLVRDRLEQDAVRIRIDGLLATGEGRQREEREEVEFRPG